LNVVFADELAHCRYADAARKHPKYVNELIANINRDDNPDSEDFQRRKAAALALVQGAQGH
jgi:hypothetical protein